MSTLLAFAWRRKSNDSSSAIASTYTQQNTQELPPEVTASSSGDTATNHPYDYPPFFIGKVTSHPSTPKGLRPRKSAGTICQELNLGTDVLNRLDWNPQPINRQNITEDRQRYVAPCLPPVASCLRSSLAYDNDANASGYGIRQIAPKRLQKAVTSPQISTSSFYSRSSTNSSRHVAESPNLKVGQAKTAVGAIVAMADARVSFHETTKAPSTLPTSSISGHEMTVLPPRSWIDDQEINQPDYDRIDDDDDSNYSFDQSYHALDVSADNLIPSRKKRKAKRLDSASNASESSSDDSSLRASPSSKNDDWRRWQSETSRYQQAKQHAEQQEEEHGWLEATAFPKRTYDFQNIVHKDLYVSQAPEQDVNVSAISQLTITKDNDRSVEGSIDYDDYDELEDEYSYLDHSSNENHDIDPMENAIRRQKIRNERRMKEDLLFAVTERLQDNESLVGDILNGMRRQTGHRDNATQILKRENFFSGFSRLTRDGLCKNVKAILTEMSTACPEDFFLSPTQIPQIQEPHDDLEQALSFCLTLLKTAIPTDKQESTHFPEIMREEGEQWKCLPGLRSCLGLEEIPESPETIRGGDTSLFSLPSESVDTTPHTSNVSLTTTITSAYSPAKTKRQRSIDCIQDDGSHLRRTLESVSNLLERLGDTCTKLLKFSVSTNMESSTLRATEEIKRIYLQLISISSDDLKSAIDSFELSQSLPPLHIARIVSEDFDENPRSNPMQMQSSHDLSIMCLPPPPPSLVRSNDPGALYRSSSHWIDPSPTVLEDTSIQQQQSSPIESKLKTATIYENDRQHEENVNERHVDSSASSSPETSMKDIVADSLDSVDDLRRTVGSFEERHEGARDAAPQTSDDSDNFCLRRNQKRGMQDMSQNRPHRVMVSE